jgi:2-methylcitrate dehydratase PrpD
LEIYTDETAVNPKYKKAREKISVIIHDDWSPAFGPLGKYEEVVITLKDGKEISAKCENPHGHPPKFLSDEEVVEKFNDCCDFAGFLTRNDQGWVKDAVFGIEKVRDISKLMELLTFGK